MNFQQEGERPSNVAEYKKQNNTSYIMARPKKQVKLKEPIKIRLKSLADGNKSI